MKRLIFPLFFLIALTSYSQESSPLFKAIESDNLTQVKALVVAGADVNKENDQHLSPLSVAINKGNVNLVKLLLESGANDRNGLFLAVQNDNIPLTKYLIEQKFIIGESIVYATENNNLEMAQLLASNGAIVDFTQKRSTGIFKKEYVSPINEAISHNNLEMVNLLIEYGLPKKQAISTSLIKGKNDLVLTLSKDLEDRSWLLIEAFTVSNDVIVKKLIEEGVPSNSVDNEGNTMLLIAAKYGNLAKVQKCLDDYNLYLHKKNNLGENALMHAAGQKSESICAYLLEKGIRIDAQNNKGETALFYSILSHSRTTFDFLISKGANINHQSLEGNTVLFKAVKLENENIVTYLIAESANIHHENKSGKSAFYYLVSNARGFDLNETKLQNLFIEAGADINTKGDGGKTILFSVIKSGKFDRIVELVSKGADPNTQDQKGERPSCKEIEIIKFLLEKGADINATDSWDNTFLCDAINENDLELAYYLVDKGIDVNKTCYFDEPAIIKAVKEKNLVMVQFLAENGADVNAIGYFKKNVMDYAQKEENEAIISYLREKGAMTKEERNAQYQASIKLESEIKAALIGEDLEAIISMISSQKIIILQEKVVRDIAYVAAKKGHSKMINKLLSDEVEFSIDSPVNDFNQTILTIATIYSQDELVIDLLAKGANVNQLDTKGKKAEDYSTKKSTTKIFKQWSKNQ